MMKRLGLRKEDLDDVVFNEEKHPSMDAIRWLAIAMVYMEKDFSDF